MIPTEIASIVFACVFGGALLGMFLRVVTPEHHLSQDSKDVMKLGMGLIATMTALVLELVIATAKSSADTQAAAVKHSAAKVLLLDRVLANYGPETKETRDLLRQIVTSRLHAIWPEDRSQPARLDAPEVVSPAQGIEARILRLAPQNDAQRWLQSQALQIGSDLMETALARGGWPRPLGPGAVPRGGGVLAYDPLREFRPLRPPQRNGRRGPVPLCAVGCWLNLPDPGDGPPVRRADEDL